MIKNFINNIKLTKLSYLLEVIEVRDFKSKIRAFEKIKRMKFTKEMGLMILDDANFDHNDDFSDFNISLSLISLVFREYYDEYTDKIKEIFPKLTNESKYEVANLLSSTKNESAIVLYKKLILKYFTNMENIPIGLLSNNTNFYDIVFPDLFKTFNFDIERNNVILLFNDYLNSGVVLEKDLKKNKKLIQSAIIDILKKGCNYKFKKDENFMQNKDYINLRMFLESAINIEYYVSNKTTQSYLEKLYKKKDNQLKLFVLDNYIRKGKNISKYSFSSIAKDDLSRYPLFSFLNFYGLSKLMPKKYNNNVELAKSDLYINYCISNNYTSFPLDMEFIEEKLINDYKYYYFKFKTNYNYYNEVQDPATDYILKTVDVDKLLVENTYANYLGISGGYNKDLDPSIIEKNLKIPCFIKIDKDINDLIEEFNPDKSFIQKDNITKKKFAFPFFKKKNKIKINEEVLKKKEKEEITESTAIEPIKEETKKEEHVTEKVSFITKLKNKFKKKDKVEIIDKPKEEKVIEEVDIPKEEVEVEKEISIFYRVIKKIFSMNTLLIAIFFVFVCCATILVLFMFNIDIFHLRKNVNKYSALNVSATTIDNDKFKEISYTDIFNKEDQIYYVLFYKKKKTSTYHYYIDELLDNNYVIYYVDLNKKDNEAIYQGNPTGFVIKDETFLKVNTKEYEFYVVGKNNILREFEDNIKYIEKLKEEKSKKEEESIETKNDEEIKKKQEENKKKAKEIIKKIEEESKTNSEETEKEEKTE
ncbi:MAG: hypothetical protein IJH20_04295 [Bacilli bacterium]|nr:hypothetical protein [Bacilli bacterium]